MKRVMAYVILNVKSLLKDKLPFAWSIFLPLVMFYVEKDHMSKEQDLAYWWIYMILCAYFYGVGLYAIELKEAGCLRTIFSIYNSSTVFFMGNLVTQIIFSIISLSIFNVAVFLIKGFSFIHLMSGSVILIFLCIPFAFLGYALVLLKKIHANTIRTLLSITLFGMFMFLSIGAEYNKFNPMYYITAILTNFILKNVYWCYHSWNRLLITGGGV
ncbi:hypothetical protein AALA79_03560 [Lachnospiraceae bacterium 64-25]